MSINETVYFSTANLKELTEIDSHLEFVESMTHKYKALETKETIQNSGKPQNTKYHWDGIYDQIERIKAKKNDEKLNLSIIGEFSTGKSTFINALLGKELLASSALQGTTVASTIIDYGVKYKLEIEYLDGSPKKKITFPGFEQLKSKLQDYTTAPDIAKQLKTVRVFLPLEVLRHDFRIIDTPGTNVTEAWHEDVTIRTIKEQSDLSIVLLSAEKQLTSTSQVFVNRYLSDILPQCIFVVTKVDLLRPRERRQVLSYIKGKVEEEFGLKDAVVLPFASLLVLDANNRYSVSDFPEVSEGDLSNGALLPVSLAGIQKIIQHTTKQKTIAITKKLAALIEQSYALLSGDMDVMSAEYRTRIALLEKSKTIDLSVFVSQKKAESLQSFDRKMRKVMDNIESSIDSMSSSATSTVLSKLDNCSNIDKLKEYITDSLAQDCRASANTMLSQSSSYHQKQRRAYKSEMNIYNTAFSKVYDSLNIVPVNMQKENLQYPPTAQIQTANIASTANYIAEQLSKENTAFFGGMAAGAALGTAILPGVGTIIGGFLGMMAGAGAAPNTEDVRRECKSKLRPQLENYYDGIGHDMMRAIESYSRQLRTSLIKEMDAYIPRYRQEVERQLLEEEKARSQVKRQSADLERDKQKMLNHKLALESVMKQLNQLGRKES